MGNIRRIRTPTPKSKIRCACNPSCQFIAHTSGEVDISSCSNGQHECHLVQKKFGSLVISQSLFYGHLTIVFAVVLLLPFRGSNLRVRESEKGMRRKNTERI